MKDDKATPAVGTQFAGEIYFLEKVDISGPSIWRMRCECGEVFERRANVVKTADKKFKSGERGRSDCGSRQCRINRAFPRPDNLSLVGSKIAGKLTILSIRVERRKYDRSIKIICEVFCTCGGKFERTLDALKFA